MYIIQYLDYNDTHQNDCLWVLTVVFSIACCLIHLRHDQDGKDCYFYISRMRTSPLIMIPIALYE